MVKPSSALGWCVAINKVCHGEERSDVAIQLDFRWIAAPAKRLAMTNGEFISEERSDALVPLVATTIKGANYPE